jgi:asparagine N-glycosylation enzyme membrane subunit Stt3
MKALYGNVDGSSWIRVQPFVVFFLSVWFFIFSILLWRRRLAGLKAARLATLIYLEIIMINGALPLIKFGSQWFLLPFWGLTASCMIIGGYLALALQRNWERETMKIDTVVRWGT